MWRIRLPAVGWYFNPRTPVGCDGRVVVLGDGAGISIHAPQWGATSHQHPVLCSRIYFNPRTPVGCDFRHQIPAPGVRISIHAPQWGATSDWMSCDVVPAISIHAPQWGATLTVMAQNTPFEFQSTHPSGVRLRRFQAQCGAFHISIHAPQWGATGCSQPQAQAAFHFNPRTPVGCDQASQRIPARAVYFNPRTPVGCDHPTPCLPPCPRISIHAPQWGATAGVWRAGPVRVISIHAPQWGATEPPRRHSRTGGYFNPRTPVGCDECPGFRLAFPRISIHAPQWGATRFRGQPDHDRHISIHAPQWGATDQD